MLCSEIEKWIESLIDDELDLPFKKNVEAHVTGCRSCERIFEGAQRLRNVLKNSLPVVSPRNGLDDSVMDAFYRKQAEREASKPTAWRRGVFSLIAIPKPAFAVLTIIFATLLGLGFQLGRISVAPAQSLIAVKQADESLLQTSDQSAPVKIVEVPLTKIVEVPVVKEKVVTRYIYLNKLNHKRIEVKSKRQNNSQLDNLAIKNSIAEDGYITQTSLKGFQPMSEIKVGIVKGGKENEK